jgi:hypothetical protein
MPPVTMSTGDLRLALNLTVNSSLAARPWLQGRVLVAFETPGPGRNWRWAASMAHHLRLQPAVGWDESAPVKGSIGSCPAPKKAPHSWTSVITVMRSLPAGARSYSKRAPFIPTSTR